MNKKWLENEKNLENYTDVDQFLLKYGEKRYLDKKRAHM